MRFKNVEEYYSFMAQGNCFAPVFKELNDKVKDFWNKEFNEYKNNSKQR